MLPGQHGKMSTNGLRLGSHWAKIGVNIASKSVAALYIAKALETQKNVHLCYIKSK